MSVFFIDGTYFNPENIAKSGQCFRWKEEKDGSYSLIAHGKYLLIEKESDRYRIKSTKEDWENIWKEYFDIERDYSYIKKLIESSEDTHLKEAFFKGRGIRILRQDLWETIVSFLISQNNNISRIKNSIEKICVKAGKLTDNKEGYQFPMPEDVNKGFFEDSGLGLGYRVEYLEEIYEYARNNPNWLNELKSKNYEDAMSSLLERKGIGPKVANCICLFGLGHVGAFPIDTHVKQLLKKYYPDGFDFERYHGCAGIIQQFLFYYEIS